MYILDTNTLIYFFKGIGNIASILLSKSPKDISIPSIALYELEVGIAKSTKPNKRRKQLELLISRISISSFGIKEAEVAAMIRANLETKGTPIGPYDTLIAGTALSANATLITHNTKEFERVNGLNIEDWY
ncbi:MAG: type II toxin-antitoxin system VapC family toxin [Thermodesulfobacteriota bacterium]|nr:type II toxin-antitoxin system VapC family toxin [Thermodesulfobacteriota bacterium]